MQNFFCSILPRLNDGVLDRLEVVVSQTQNHHSYQYHDDSGVLATWFGQQPAAASFLLFDRGQQRCQITCKIGWV